MENTGFKHWFKQGEPWLWLNAAAVSLSILLVLGLLGLIAVNGLRQFWPHDVNEYLYLTEAGEYQTLMGQPWRQESVRIADISGDTHPGSGEAMKRLLLHQGNRETGVDEYRWLELSRVVSSSPPTSAVVLNRYQLGNFYGYVLALQQQGEPLAGDAWTLLQQQLPETARLRQRLSDLESGELGSISAELERLRLKQRRLELKQQLDAAELARINRSREQLDAAYQAGLEQLQQLRALAGAHSVRVQTAAGEELNIPLLQISQAYRPNDFHLSQRLRHFLSQFWLFISDKPRAGNTEGGIFPAIFGTVLMVILMSIFVTPFGVLAAIYLHEYAGQGWLARAVRIAVNNLAGVPSIVYGVFGLAFFVYAIGGSIDQLFFPESLPAPTFGTGGLLWASLTLALLTLPVVIVTAEEGLARIPRSLREGSLALGATQAETLWRTLLPVATPSIITGVILAVARAAGEVAPLMLVGVVKLAASIPIDGHWPYLHLERKFMHMGFHIYDMGFQSHNIEASRPVVYTTALLLVAVVVLLNLTAIWIRNRLREKYRRLEV